ncbi:MAG: DUF726 domain-containing protein [Kiritimatiellae bacterium]|nr:DUF726 domain-containing protein [Kiritimatiellia bacterium]
MTVAALAATVWFIPGWLRAEKPAAGVVECVERAFPEANVVFKSWDGDSVVWPIAVDAADKEAWRFAFEIATMPAAERERLTLVGHSLGGRIVARVLARLSEHGMKVRQAVLMGAAIPSDDGDLAKMGRACELPVLAVCNPDDLTLRYVYATVGALAGGEKGVAFGANGTLAPCENVVECVTPTNLAHEVEIDEKWAKSRRLRDIANHHEKFYLDYLRRLLDGEEPSGEVMVPQDFPTVEGRVMDAMVWWDVLGSSGGWKLEKNKVTGHCRILDPAKRRTAWGRESEMRAAFEKVRQQISK